MSKTNVIKFVTDLLNRHRIENENMVLKILDDPQYVSFKNQERYAKDGYVDFLGMTENKKIIRGSGGGGSPSPPPQPTRTPDTLHSRQFEPDNVRHGLLQPRIHCLLGANDTVINPYDTHKILQFEPKCEFMIKKHGHRTPVGMFKKIINSI